MEKGGRKRGKNDNVPEKDRQPCLMSPDLEPNLPPRPVSCHLAEGHQPPEPHQSGPFHPNLKQENQFFTFPALEVFKTSTVYLFQYNSKMIA